jgi:cold shock protein
MSEQKLQTGIVRFYSSARGYGFIVRDNGLPDLFVHINDVVGRTELREGLSVQFIPGTDKRNGKPVAQQVEEFVL